MFALLSWPSPFTLFAEVGHHLGQENPWLPWEIGAASRC